MTNFCTSECGWMCFFCWIFSQIKLEKIDNCFLTEKRQSGNSRLKFNNPIDPDLRSQGNFDLSDSFLQSLGLNQVYFKNQESCDSMEFRMIERFWNFRVLASRFGLQYKMNRNKISSNLVKISLPLFGPFKISLNGWKKRMKQ